MEREGKLELLSAVLHGTVNSIVQYIDVARPYVPPTCEEKMGELARLRDEEVATAHDIVERISALDGVPSVEAFPYWNIDLNYLDVRFLARFAAGHQEKAIAELEEALPKVRDDAAVHALLEKVLEQKRSHLAVLEDVAQTAGPEVDEERREKAQPLDAQHVPRPVRDA